MSVRDWARRLIDRYVYMGDIKRREREVAEVLAEKKESDARAFDRVASATASGASAEASRKAGESRREAERLRRAMAADDAAIDVLRGE